MPLRFLVMLEPRPRHSPLPFVPENETACSDRAISSGPAYFTCMRQPWTENSVMIIVTVTSKNGRAKRTKTFVGEFTALGGR